jgi:hypothetical protein
MFAQQTDSSGRTKERNGAVAIMIQKQVDEPRHACCCLVEFGITDSDQM